MSATLWAFCPHCETLFLDVCGKELIHSCPGKMVPPDPDSDDEFVRCAGKSDLRRFITGVGACVKLEPRVAKNVSRGQ